MDALCVEGVPQVAHFIKNAPESPHITLVTVGLGLEQLGRHVVWRTDARVREIFRVVQDSRNTKVSETDLEQMTE